MSTSTDSISVQAAKEHPLPELAPGNPVGAYEVVRKVGEGMLGAVYEVKSRSGERKALKLLRSGLLKDSVDADRLRSQVEEAFSVSGPGVLPLQEVGSADGHLFVVRDFVPGGSLRDLLDDYKARGEDVAPEDLRDITTQTLEILQRVHGTGLHRNLKPENILLRDDATAAGKGKRQVVLVDYAIARVLDPSRFSNSEAAREGAFYLAPELSEFEGRADASADLYSVAAIIYEMLVGEPPVGRYLMPSEVRDDISNRIDDLIEIALNPNHQDRFQSAADMLGAFRQVYAELYGGTESRKRTLVLLAGLIVAAIGAAMYFKSQEKTPEELRAEEMVRRERVRAEVKGATQGAAASNAGDPKYADMVWVPGGPYLAGKFLAFDDSGLAGERIEARVDVPGFWIDKHERHVAERVAGEGDDPEAVRSWNLENAGKVETDRTWSDARQICQSVGKRLCSEDEWEKACKGPDNLTYAYGDEYEAGKCPTSGYFEKYRVQQHPGCVSGYGVYGMSGGIAEWTATRRGDSYILKPGEVGKDEASTRCAGRFDRAANFGQLHLGVRCCAD